MKEKTNSSLDVLDMVKCGVEQMLLKVKMMGYGNIVEKNVMLLQSSESCC